MIKRCGGLLTRIGQREIKSWVRIRARRLLHERQVALHAVAEFGMSGLADQHVVRSWGGAGADTEQCIERRMPCSAPIEAEHELVEVVLEVGPPQSVVNAQTPALEI